MEIEFSEPRKEGDVVEQSSEPYFVRTKKEVPKGRAAYQREQQLKKIGFDPTATMIYAEKKVKPEEKSKTLSAEESAALDEELSKKYAPPPPTQEEEDFPVIKFKMEEEEEPDYEGDETETKSKYLTEEEEDEFAIELAKVMEKFAEGKPITEKEEAKYESILAKITEGKKGKRASSEPSEPRGRGIRIGEDKEPHYAYKQINRTENPLFAFRTIRKKHLEETILPKKTEMLVTVKDKMALYETEIGYKESKLMKVGPKGELVPTRGTLRRIGEEFPKPIRSPEKKKFRPNEFNSAFPIGENVSFDVKKVLLRGQIVDANKEGLVVDVAGKKHDVLYSNRKLKLSPRVGSYVSFSDKKEKKHGIVSSVGLEKVEVYVREDKKHFILDYDNLKVVPKPTDTWKSPPPRSISSTKVEDMYAKPVPDQLRAVVKDVYVAALKDMITSATSEVSKKTTIKRSVAIREPIPWDLFYEREFKAWMRASLHEPILASLDLDKIQRRAQRAYDRANAPETYIHILIEALNSYEKDLFLDDGTKVTKTVGFTFQTTAQDLIAALKKSASRQVSTFDAFVIRQAEKASVGVPIIQGKDFAVMVRNIIERYLVSYPPNLEAIYQAMVNKSIDAKFVKKIGKDTSREQKRFRKEEGKKLKKTHALAVEEYEKALDVYKKDQLRAEQEKLIMDTLGQRIATLKDQVSVFEKSIYDKYEKLGVREYLLKALFPYIFMTGALAAHAKIFRAKIANGSYDFAALDKANLAHYLPEFVMNADEEASKWETASKSITNMLNIVVDETIELYYTMLNPTIRKRSGQQFMSTAVAHGAGDLIKMLGNPQKICEKDTGSGAGVDDGDLVICYDQGKFSCHSSLDLAQQLAKGQKTNPLTGTDFPSDFIEKIKDRYRSVKIGKKKTVEKIVLLGKAASALGQFGDITLSDGREILGVDEYSPKDKKAIVLVGYDKRSFTSTQKLKFGKSAKVFYVFVGDYNKKYKIGDKKPCVVGDVDELTDVIEQVVAVVEK